jgi:hypothetical protein
MHVEHCILTQAPPDVIFRTWQDVAHWHTWDPETRQARPDGPLLPGAPGQAAGTGGVPCNAPLTGPPAFSAPAPATAGGRRTG